MPGHIEGVDVAIACHCRGQPGKRQGVIQPAMDHQYRAGVRSCGSGPVQAGKANVFKGPIDFPTRRCRIRRGFQNGVIH